jgi:hypothetical protein
MRPFDTDRDFIGTKASALGQNILYRENLENQLYEGIVFEIDNDYAKLNLGPIFAEQGNTDSIEAKARLLYLVVFDDQEEVKKWRGLDTNIDEIGSKVFIFGRNIGVAGIDIIRDKLYEGRIVMFDDNVVGVEFNENIGGHSCEGVAKDGHGYWALDKEIFIPTSVDSQRSVGIKSAIRNIISELMLTNLSKTNSNRVNLVIEDLKSKVGEDWEAEVRNAIEPEAAAEIFISLIRELEKQEQERLQFGSVQTTSIPTTKQPKPATSGKRGRPRKDKTPEPKPMPTTPQVNDVQSEEDLSTLLDDLLNL